jgi:hypothetical protein
LKALDFPGKEFNESLAQLTERAISKNGSQPINVPLLTIRTNETSFAEPWEMRQFKLDDMTGLVKQMTVDQTPDTSWLGSPLLGDFINTNEKSILSGRYRVPRLFAGERFQGGSSLNFFPVWNSENIISADARKLFALGTCNGCHGKSETGTNFLHVITRDAGEESRLSGYLLGVAIRDPVTGELLVHNDIERRKSDMEKLVCRCRDSDCGKFMESRDFHDHFQE